MFITYGYKKVELKTVDLPTRCTCNTPESLFIYRTFLTLFYIPLIPLKKTGLIYCKFCGKETKKRHFLKRLESEGKDSSNINIKMEKLIKETWTPRLNFCSLFLLVSVLIIITVTQMRLNYQMNQWIKSYIENPTKNALLVIHVKEDEYPYYIAFIPQKQDEDFIFIPWNYSYMSIKDAENTIQKIKKDLLSHKTDISFDKAILIDKDTLANFEIKRIEYIKDEIDWISLINVGSG